MLTSVDPGTLRKFYSALKLGFSLLTITDGVIFVQNSRYQYERDWGYNKESTICIPLENEKQFEVLKNNLKDYSNIISIAGSRQHLGYSFSNEGVEVSDEKYNVEKFDIGFNYLETYGVDLKTGRYFSEDTKNGCRKLRNG